MDKSAISSIRPDAQDANLRARAKWFLIFTAGLAVCFGSSLFSLLRFSFNSELYSHVLLVPVISGYLIWTDRNKLDRRFKSAPLLTALLLICGIALVAGYWTGVVKGWRPGSENDRLSPLTLAFLLFFASGLAWFFGSRILRSIIFPVLFLIFMVPLPLSWETGLVDFLQHASAELSYWFLTLSGMSVFRQGTEFSLPGVTIGVAPECSGVRSTLVLFMTGLLAAYFFLRRPWAKITLAALLIPLGIMRNAFRIFTLAELAVNVNPDILNSNLHHRGGPIFFAISLVPFFLLIWLLRKCETRFEKKGRTKEQIPNLA